MISNSVNLKQLDALLAVLDHGSFRAAAAQLGTTQPNISGRIAALEAALGTVLLLRDAGSVRLTEAGARLVPHARAVVAAAATLIEEAGRRDLIEGRLRIGVTELVAATFAHALMGALRAEYPALTLDLTVALSRDLDAGLARGAIDLALHNAPFEAPGMIALPLGRCGYAWCATPALAAGLPAGAGLAEFARGPVLTHARPTAAVTGFDAECARRGLSLRHAVQSSSLASALQMARGGMGIALLPLALIAPALRAGELVLLASDWHPEPLDFAARHARARALPMIRRGAALACRLAAEDQDFLSS